MKFLTTSLLAGLILICTGFSAALHAQAQLERISISERADGRGYVVRFHLSEMAESYQVTQPRINLVQLRLGLAGLDAGSVLLPDFTDEIRNIELHRIADGYGVDILLGVGTYLAANAYPDANGRDLLVSLEYVALPDLRERIHADAFKNWRAQAEPQHIPDIQAPVRQPESDPQPPLPDPAKKKVSVQFGIAGGFTSSAFRGTEFGADRRPETTIGTSVNISLPFMLPYEVSTGVETGIYYVQKGITNPEGQSGIRSINIDYFEVPVLAKFNYPFMDLINPYFVTGPYFAIMVSAESQQENGNFSDMDQLTRKTEFGGIVGLGADFPLGAAVFTLQTRYSFGFTPVFEENFGDGEKNGVLSLVFGIRF